MKNNLQILFFGHSIYASRNLNVSGFTFSAELKSKSNGFFGSYYGFQSLYNLNPKNQQKNKTRRNSSVSNLEKFSFIQSNENLSQNRFSKKFEHFNFCSFCYRAYGSKKKNYLKMKNHAAKKTGITSSIDTMQNQEPSKNYSEIFLNFVFDKGRLKAFVLWFLQNYGQKRTIELLEQLKQIGFGYATKAGISLGIDDLRIPPQKRDLLLHAQVLIDDGSVQYKRGEITGVEKFQRLIDTWHQTSENLKQAVIRHFEETDLLNPVYMMAFSGARGNISQVRQLVGMRGLMSDPQGQIIDFPIRSNFREGLTLTEYIISSYGARKGIVDTALRTANAGYLTRRLVDVAQHVIVCEFDCKTNRGILVLDMKEGNKTIYSFQNRLLGRVLAKDIFDKQQKIAARNQEISSDLANSIAKITKKALIRSPLTCETKKLVCQLCYGWSLSTSNLVSIGEAVGIIAAQSIGEPGTQLTMRTFHTGGVFSGGLSEQIIAQTDGVVEYSSPIPGICVRTLQGQIAFLTKAEGCLIFKTISCDASLSQSSLDTKTPNSLPPHTKIVSSEMTDQGQQANKIWNIPPYTVLFARNKQKVFKKQIIAQLSSLSLSGEIQKTPRGDAEQTIYALFEGQIYNSNLDVIEKFNEYNDLTSEAWDWGYLWILAGKIYQYPIQSYVFARPGDFIGKNSVLNRIEWISADKFFLNTDVANNTETNLSNGLGIYSMSYPQNDSTLAYSPSTLEMDKRLNFFQQRGSTKKNVKLSIPTRYEKQEARPISFEIENILPRITPHSERDDSKISLSVKKSNRMNLKTLKNREQGLKLSKLLRNSFLKNHFRIQHSPHCEAKASIKIHSNRLVRTKFFRKNFETESWKFINSLNNLNLDLSKRQRKFDSLNVDYPFHKFLRKHLSANSKEKRRMSYKTRERYLHKLGDTKTSNFLYENHRQKYHRAYQMNRARFLELTENRNLDDSFYSNKKSKSPSHLNFRITMKNQSNFFVSNQSTYLKKWKSLRFVYPYVNKKTIKNFILSKDLGFQKDLMGLQDRKTKLLDDFSRLDPKKGTGILLSDRHFSLESLFKKISNGELIAQNKSQFKKFHFFQKKRMKLGRMLSSKISSKSHKQHINNKSCLILNESNFKKIVRYDRQRRKKNDFSVHAANSKKISFILLKKSVLSLSLKNLRYRKLGYHFSYDFQNACDVAKSKNNSKKILFSSSEIRNSKNANKSLESRYLTNSPLNFGYYASNKNKDEFFNKFSLKTSVKSLDRLKDKQNTYEWEPMFNFFLRWFPSSHQTLNNGVFIFSGIRFTRPFLFQTKNSSIFSSNRKKNSQRTYKNWQSQKDFKLNCYQFKRKSTNQSSTNKIYDTKNEKFNPKQILTKLPILKNLKFNDTINYFSSSPQEIREIDDTFDFSLHKKTRHRVLKTQKTIVIKKQPEQMGHLTNKTQNSTRSSVFSSNDNKNVFYSLIHRKKSTKQTKFDIWPSKSTSEIEDISSSTQIFRQHPHKKYNINQSVLYSLNAPQLNFFKKSKKNHKPHVGYKTLRQVNVYDFKASDSFYSNRKISVTNLKQQISIIKNILPRTSPHLESFSENRLRWQNKQPKLFVHNKYFSRMAKKNSTFRKKAKIANSFDKTYNKKSTHSSFGPRSKFSVSWNEIFWIPQEDYQISVWPSRNKMNFQTLNSTVDCTESTEFMNTKSRSLFCLTNRQGLKKPFRCKLEGFSKIFIKPANTSSSWDKEQPVFTSDVLRTEDFSSSSVKSEGNQNSKMSRAQFKNQAQRSGVLLQNQINIMNNESFKMNAKHSNLIKMNTFIDFSLKAYEFKRTKYYEQNPVFYKFPSDVQKQNEFTAHRIHRPTSLDQIHQTLKLSLIDFIKNKWQKNCRHTSRNDQKFDFKKQYDRQTDRKKHVTRISFYDALKETSSNQKYKNQLSLYSYARTKFMSKNTFLANVPITSQCSRQKTLFSRFMFQKIQTKNKTGLIQNQINSDQKMRISIQPGWVYMSLNRSDTTKCHQKIIDFGKFVVDDLLFTNHRVYVKNIVLKNKLRSIDAAQSKTTKTNIDDMNSSEMIAVKSIIFFDDSASYSQLYSFNSKDCHSFCSAESKNNEESNFSTANIYKVDKYVSSSKSRYGDFILKYGMNITPASNEIPNSTIKTTSMTLNALQNRQETRENSVRSDGYLAMLIRPMHHRILPNLHFYKTKIYRAHKKLLESNFSILAYKNFHLPFLNKQKCDQKFISTFPGIDIKISSSSLCHISYPRLHKMSVKKHRHKFVSKIDQKVDSFYSKIALGASSVSKTSKNQSLFSKMTPLKLDVFSNRRAKSPNSSFEKTPVRHCFEQSYLTLIAMNFLPLNLEFSIPSSFHYLFKIPLFNFNSSANMCFAEQRITKELRDPFDDKIKTQFLNDLVLKNQRKFSLLKSSKNIVSTADSIKNKSFLDSLASLSFLPHFDFWLSAKMSYLANQRLFASYFNSRELSSTSKKNASAAPCLLESFGNFPVSENQVASFPYNRVSPNEPFATTSLKSSLRGEMLFKPSRNWSSETNQNRCLILTESDLFSVYLPKIADEKNIELECGVISFYSNTGVSEKKESDLKNANGKNFKNEFSGLYQNFLRLEQIQVYNIEANKQKDDQNKKNDNIIVQYNKKFYKIKELKIGLVKSRPKLRLGSLLVYGDIVALSAESSFALDQAGQIIHMNASKVTFRCAQPISVSPKGVLHAYNRDFVTQNAAVITLPFQTLKTGDIVQGIPKVEQYFEARTTKRGRLYRDSLPNLLQGLFERYRSLLPLDKAVRQSFLKIQQIIVDGVQRVYRSQGVSISDKHLEVVVRQMTSKVQIVHGGQTGFFPGELVDLEFVEYANQFLLKKIYYEPVVLGITRASLEVESFLSAASFQQTTKVLSKAAVYRKKDFLKGLKENIIVGNLIPGGTGYLVHLKEFFNLRSKNSNA